MSKIIKLEKKIVQPGFYNITENINKSLKSELSDSKNSSGILTLFCLHTSCALLINEAWDPTAQKDLENFFDYIAPENLPFVQHVLEGPDDSPAHMKSALLHQSIALIVEGQQCLLGRWQGIFLAEFRNGTHNRSILMKFQPDH